MGNGESSTDRTHNCGNVCSGLGDCWNRCGQRQSTAMQSGCTSESRAVTFNDAVNLCKFVTDFQYTDNWCTAANGYDGAWRYRCCKIGSNNNGRCDGNAAPMLPDGSENPNNNDIFNINDPADTYMIMNIGYISDEIAQMNHTIHGVIIVMFIAILLWVIKCICGVCKYYTKKLSKSKSIGNVKYDKVAIVTDYDSNDQQEREVLQ
mmetsp:Transcript_23624/g.20686  ORF Transcript_23624/g.20686 Transcript_23624/m.20686 type:complete len:206 (-) Transcript_23624:104-721(-)